MLLSEPSWTLFWIIRRTAQNRNHQRLEYESLDFAHVFCYTIKELEEEFSKTRQALKKTGAMWVSSPKKSSKIRTDLNGNVVRTYGLNNGLVDVKVAAIDEDWSALKFMYRLKDR